MSKNILVFSDGTGQEGGVGNNTNIYKLFNMVEDRTPDQIAFYDRGIGTGREFLTGLAFGRGFGRNVRDCYQFIFNNYQAGDRVFLFGFSRGAATVRSLSYFIHLFGILPHSRPDLIPKAWDIYRSRNEEKREEEARAFVKRHHTMWTDIHFLGVYDTVAALGSPSRLGSVVIDKFLRHRFHNYHLSPGVLHAYHALAVDDERKTFHPLLWEPVEVSRQTRTMACKEMKQVWFLGMHTDVGGGYAEQELSDIPLVWLTQQAVALGLRIYPGHDVPIAEEVEGHMHDSRAHGWTRMYAKQVRSWPDNRPDVPLIHESVLARVRSRNNGESARYESWLAPWIEAGRYETEPWIRYPQQPWYRQP